MSQSVDAPEKLEHCVRLPQLRGDLRQIRQATVTQVHQNSSMSAVDF